MSRYSTRHARYQSGESVTVIAEKIGRMLRAIESRLERLGC